MYNYMGPGWRLTATLLAPCVTVMVGVFIVGFRNNIGYWPIYTRRQWGTVAGIVVLAVCLPHLVFYCWWHGWMIMKYLLITLCLSSASTVVTAGLSTTVIALDERLRS